MHTNILTEEQKKLLPLISSFSDQFYLVGGTALALQYGHRRSLDFDLFTTQPFDNQKIIKQIEKTAKITKVHLQSPGELTLRINGIHATFLKFDNPVKHPLMYEQLISMPDDLTIGAMKAFAIGNRSKWKDYADIHFILQKHSITEIIDLAEQIFGIGEFNSQLFRAQLAYHQDINYQEEIEWMPGFATTKEDILASLIEASLSRFD
jgi:hypothetical protein